MSSEKTAHSIRYHWSGMTHPGRYRKNNEDGFLIMTFNEKEIRYLGKEDDSTDDMSRFIFAVSDGMGGANAGEFASKIALEKTAAWLPQRIKNLKTQDSDRILALMAQLCQDINKEIDQMARHYEECKGMGATLSLGYVNEDSFYFSHVGDCRIYLIPQDGPMKQVTQDHTHVGWLLAQGKITAYEARHHPERHVLKQALGGKNRVIDPYTGTLTLAAGDTLVFCTDGIIDGVFDRNLEEMIRNPNQLIKDTVPSKRLVDEAMFSSGRDNLTALVVKRTV